ncbi:MAG: hypothetical protein FWG82_02875 [Oscillospiraceae bacterium]|nr:hypothetical protein [Oscillospiraceae bacterium]
MRKLKIVPIILAMLLILNACSVWEYVDDWFEERIIRFLPGNLVPEQDWDLPPEPIVNTQKPQSRHYYERLEPRLQHAYLYIEREMPNFPERIEIPEMDAHAVAQVVRAYSYDNPVQFNMGENYTIVTQGGRYYFQPEYRFEREDYEEFLRQATDVLEELAAAVDRTDSDFKRQLALHDALLERVVYASDRKPHEATFYGALVLGRASCEGYARGMKLLLEELGIENVLLTGNATNRSGRTEAHMWNLVLIDGLWYHLDPTWNDVENDEIRYDYFNLNDEEIGISHDISDSWLKAVSTQANFFRKTGMFFEDYDSGTREAVTSALRESLKNGKYQIEMRFSTRELMETAKDALTNPNGGDIYRMLDTASLASRDPILTNEISFSFNEHLGVVRFGVIRK